MTGPILTMAPKVKRKSISDKTPRSAARLKKARSGRKAAAPSRFGSFFLPLFLSICLMICLGVLGYLGLQNVTASKFFDVRAVEVYGTVRASREEIGRAAAHAADKTGVWNADLIELKAKIEKLPFVKTASVSRVLPDGLRVNVVERVPISVVKLSGGDMLVDEEGNLLAAGKREGGNAAYNPRRLGRDEDRTGIQGESRTGEIVSENDRRMARGRIGNACKTCRSRRPA